MKKALVVANLAGFASFLINDIKLLQQIGYSVSFAANGDKFYWEDTKAKLDELNVSFINVGFDSKNPFSKSNCKAYKQIKKILKEGQYDLIHCHTPIAGLITRLAARKFRKHGTKVIYTTHGFAFNSCASRKAWLVYFTLENFGSHFCDATITINKEDYLNAQKMHCKNVYNINGVGVDISKYHLTQFDRVAYRNKVGIPNDKIMILSVGELSDRKNHRVIIDALSLLSEKDKFIYVICGAGIEGNIGHELEEQAKNKGIELKLMGFRHDIPEMIACSDIGAIPSKREGLGLAGIQSLACEVPLVGSNVQGIRDYIVDGKTGYLCDANDPVQFSEKIKLLAAMPDKEKLEMKKNCYEMALKFDISVASNQMENIYKIFAN